MSNNTGGIGIGGALDGPFRGTQADELHNMAVVVGRFSHLDQFLFVILIFVIFIGGAFIWDRISVRRFNNRKKRKERGSSI